MTFFKIAQTRISNRTAGNSVGLSGAGNTTSPILDIGGVYGSNQNLVNNQAGTTNTSLTSAAAGRNQPPTVAGAGNTQPDLNRKCSSI